MEQTAKEFRSWYSEVMENDWEMAKKSMLNSFGFENVAEYQHDRSMMANPPTQTPMKPRSFVPASEGREQKVPPVASKNQLYGECVRRIAFDRAAPDSRNINVISTFLEMRQKLVLAPSFILSLSLSLSTGLSWVCALAR